VNTQTQKPNKSFDEREFFYGDDLNEDSRIMETPIPIENLRRKSCECEKCGFCCTLIQKKASLLTGNFQTQYDQKKAEMQKMLNDLEREKKSTIISSIFALKKP